MGEGEEKGRLCNAERLARARDPRGGRSFGVPTSGEREKRIVTRIVALPR